MLTLFSTSLDLINMIAIDGNNETNLELLISTFFRQVDIYSVVFLIVN